MCVYVCAVCVSVCACVCVCPHAHTHVCCAFVQACVHMPGPSVRACSAMTRTLRCLSVKLALLCKRVCVCVCVQS
jgi:hypothetical protein